MDAHAKHKNKVLLIFLALFKFSVDFKRLDKSEAEGGMMGEFLRA
ncbi:MAG: hypothetical protein Q4A24_08045 [Akkermansia sp.]|nr:hypothetical protein [Akkermansia sp.]